MTSTAPVSYTDHTLQLPDGRTLAYAEYGPSTGPVLVYCHGYPGVRTEAEGLATAGARYGVRIIGLDRPGMGRSSFQQGRTFLDWPDDLVTLTNHLQIERFSVVGISGGAPYALACASKIPERLVSCGIVSGMGPLELGTAGMSLRNRFIFFAARRLPWLLTPLLGSLARSFQNETRAKKMMAQSLQQLVPPDRECILALGLQDRLLDVTREVFRYQGVRGASYEGRLYGRAWGFKLEDIPFQPIYLWHGALDANVPLAMGQAVASKLAGCTATFYPDEGHLSTLLNHGEEIISALFSSHA